VRRYGNAVELAQNYAEQLEEAHQLRDRIGYFVSLRVNELQRMALSIRTAIASERPLDGAALYFMSGLMLEMTRDLKSLLSFAPAPQPGQLPS